MPNDDVTLKEVLETVGDVLETVNKGFSGVQTQIEGLKTDVAGLKQDVAGLKKDVVEIKAVMVTKDYLDEKLGTVNGKIAILTGILQRNGTSSEAERTAVHA
jgi:archaellum component FlaC